MKLLAQIPETVMVAAFLKAELYSERFAGDLKKVMNNLGVAEQLIASPDTQNDQENDLRAKTLGDYRGYEQNREIFTDFPDDLTWYNAALTRDEIGNLQYVDYSYWNELTDHTHLVKDAVKNIQQGKVVFDVSNERFLKLVDKIRNNEHNFEPIILWGKDKHSPLTILEGHLRATAFGLAGDEAPESIPAVVGFRE